MLSVSEQEKRLWLLMTKFPELPMMFRLIILLLNVFIPGIIPDIHRPIVGSGTILMAFKYPNLSKIQITIGVVQLLTCMMIIGWVWSICWGVLLIIQGGARPSASVPHAVSVNTGAYGAQGRGPATNPYGAYPAGNI